MISILCVDDDPTFLSLQTRCLEVPGVMTVTTALSAREALKEMETNRFDAVVADYQMPDMNGIELLREVRAAHPGLPFILFTGKGREEIIIEALNAGADFYVQKNGEPKIQFSELKDTIFKAVKIGELWQALHDSEIQYRRLFETAQDGILILDAESGEVTDANPFLLTLIGYTRDELLGKKLWEIGVIKDKALAEQAAADLKRTGYIRYEDLPLWTKDGRAMEVEFVSNVYDVGNKIVIQCNIRDISQRKQAELELVSARDNLKEAHRLAHIGIWSWVLENDTVTWSEELFNIAGRDPTLQAPTYAEHQRIYTPASWDRMSGAVTRSLTTGEPYNLELELVRPDGSIRWVNAFGGVKRDGNGTVIGLQGTVQDITAHKRAEEIQRLSEAHFTELFDTISSGVAIYEVKNDGLSGKDFIIKDFNKAALALEGRKKEEVVGKSLFDLRPAIDDYGLIPIFRGVWKTGDPAYYPAKVYVDENFANYYENRVFRLPGGEIVAVYNDVTEQKWAEEETGQLLISVQQEREKLSSLINSITDEVWFSDTDRRFTLANPQALKEFNLKQSDQTNVEKLASSLEVLHSDGTPRTVEEAPPIRALPGEIIKNMEEIVRTPATGELRYRQVSAAPVKDASGNIIGSVSVVRDVTDKKRAEEALRESEEKFRALYTHMVEGAALHKLTYNDQGVPEDYIIIETNSAFEKHLGFSRDTVIGKTSREAYGVAEPPYLDIYAQVALTGEPKVFETYFPPLAKHFSISAYCPYKGVFATIFEDITDRKQIEEVLKTSQIQLGEAMDLAHLVNWEFDVATGIFTFNDRFYALYATTAEREGGYQMPAQVYAREFVHPDDQHIVADEVNKAIQATDPDFVSYIEHRIIRRDGETRYIIVRFGIMKDDAGRTIKTHGANQDITDRKLMEEEIISLNKVLEQRVEQRTESLNKSLQEKDILFKEVHHRVKNNMQIIISLLNLQSRTIDDPGVLKTIKDSQSRIRAMALVHERLYQSGDISRIDLKDYIQYLAQELFSFYGVKSHLIRFTINAPAINVNIDTAIPVGLMVNELISNAIKYAFPEGRKGEIVIDITKDKNTISLVVRDNGIGIPAEFDWHNAKSLGIRLVNSLVEQLQGTIELDRTAGTTFNIIVKEKE